ncbi:MAG: thiamine-phosphate kinase [Chitinispirillaceae bacterium]|nr:thiamine-phosphate kinase [Chitinispirillaceae bacterium]
MEKELIPSNEYELIKKIKSIIESIAGKSKYYEVTIGDDAAVRKATTDDKLIVTTDISVEDIHFSLSYMGLKEIGYKAIVSNLSDCAAMGAMPESAFIQLVIPQKGENVIEKVEELYTGFGEACKNWNFHITGGDISIGKEWMIGITLIGRVSAKQRLLLRKGLKKGDNIWLTGIPGRSAAGLAALKKLGRESLPSEYSSLIEAHIRPLPKIKTGIALAKKRSVHSMMDTSDGLSKDCRTLCYENDCGIILEFSPSQLPQAMIKLSNEIGIPWERWVFHGGEDYELLFAADEKFNYGSLKNIEGNNFICIGKVTDKYKTVMLKKENEIVPLEDYSYDHIKLLL